MSHLTQFNKDLQETLEKMKTLQKNQKESLEKFHSIKSEIENQKTIAPPRAIKSI